MSDAIETYYYFKDGTKVKLIHYVCNKCAAEKAMLKTYGKSQSDISHTGRSKMPGNAYATFDGTDFH